jgi:DNA-binding response OmpR family regulator
MQVVLVIEDDLDTNEAIVGVLTAEGYSCLVAYDGDEGMRLLQKHQPALVVLDLQLPGLPGVEFLVRKSGIPALAEIPVVVVTGLSNVPKLDKVVAMLRKPFTIDDILDIVWKFAPLPTPKRA